MMLILLAVIIVAGPLLVVLGAISLAHTLRWGADCVLAGHEFECGTFFGLFQVNHNMVETNLAGFAIGFAVYWAIKALAVLSGLTIIYLIWRAFW